MSSYELIIKIIPYCFWAVLLIFVFLLLRHLKEVRVKEMQDEIKLGEDEIQNHINALSDSDVASELNKLEGPTVTSSDPLKKE